MTNLTKEQVIEFQNATLDRISEHIWDYGQNTVGNLDLPTCKKDSKWLAKCIEVELEGCVAIVEEYHGV